MYWPPLQPVSKTEFLVSGNVIIDPQATIAGGVILQAIAPGRIVIEAGACLGMGAIINVTAGEVRIQSGAIIGSGVLIVEASHIGANSCVGAATTIIKSRLAPKSQIPAGSLLGDTSRQVESLETPMVTAPESLSTEAIAPESKTDLPADAPPKVPEPPQRKEKITQQGYQVYFASRQQVTQDMAEGHPLGNPGQSPENSEKQNNQNPMADPWALNEPAIATPSESSSPAPHRDPPTIDETEPVSPPTETPPKKSNPVVGQAYINELLSTLFPHQPNLSNDPQPQGQQYQRN